VSASTNPGDLIGLGIMLLVATPFVLIALYFFYIWYRDRRHARATYAWTPTTGRVMNSNIASHRSYSSSSHTHTTVYEPQVVYEYMAKGMRYQSNQISVGAGYSTSMEGMVEQQVSRYPAGGPVQVFYNPSNPQEAVLEHGSAGGNLYLFLALFIFFVVGITAVPMLVARFASGQFFSQLMNAITGLLKR